MIDPLFAQYPDDALLEAAAENRKADVIVAGTVAGEPTFFFGRSTHAWHERFPIVTEHGMRVDVIDNVSLAPRVPVQPGDVIAVAGQFVPTRNGPIIHDTHHSPGPGWHRDGWVEWHGQRFEPIDD
ncbi:MAG TPA: DUF3465 domain-containing protein [Candidatus Eremiobacteraceae bacterium]|nr:DUF3465 domain-containing protein [Candidatus Eremiobacteraceae bacterium]